VDETDHAINFRSINKFMKKTALLFLLATIPFVAGSHIGSPGVTFEGQAGPYHVLVLVTPPDVIPGTARVDIYTSSQGIRSIWGKPVYWHAGDESTPSADPMMPVEGEPGHYSGMIWLMSAGTSGIDLKVDGDAGSGSVLVPVMAISTAQKDMPASLGYGLVVLCVLLVTLMITIISSSVSDGLVKPGAEMTAVIRRKRWIGAAVSTVILVLILWGGKSWWDTWASRYQRFLYKPLRANSVIVPEKGKSLLEFRIDISQLQNLRYTRRLSYVIPDHGKLMHMFLVRAGSMDVFAHLHPQRKDSATYITPLPPLPGGKYLVFADVTRVSGFSETIPDTIEIAKTPVAFAANDSLLLNRDDTYFITDPVSGNENTGRQDNIVVCGRPGVKTVLPDGSTAIWEHEPGKTFEAGRLYELTFAIQDEHGRPAALEPYLGMMGHAVVMKTDGSVYIHLHPVGSYSMASQQTMLTRFEKETGPVNWASLNTPSFMDSIDQVVARLEAMPEQERNDLLMADMQHITTDAAHPDHAVVKFPYAFPSPGTYRIWIQMKRNGRILNSAFDAVAE
jgi:hypothetical protein